MPCDGWLRFALVFVFVVSACGDDGGPSVRDGGSDDDAGSGADAGTPTDAGESIDGGGDRPAYEPGSFTGELFVGHYGSPFELAGLDTTTLDPTEGSPLVPDGPGSDILALGQYDVVLMILEGSDDLLVARASTLMPLSWSPISPCRQPTAIAHDDVAQRLYVACIGTPGRPEQSELAVLDTSSEPWMPIAGSPFDFDMAVGRMVVDPVTGRLFGGLISRFWAVEVGDDGPSHLEGSPLDVEGGTFTALALDPERRRVYWAARSVSGPQSLRAYDVDTFTPVAGTPVEMPPGRLGDAVIDPIDGTLFVVDYGNRLLHALSADPLTLLDTCGTMGCSIPPTETGLALDFRADRLFIVHFPDAGRPGDGTGFVTAWDVSDPEMPAEVTEAGSRPQVHSFPNQLALGTIPAPQ